MPDSSLDSFDAKLARTAFFEVATVGGGKNETLFQFAPKIISESNSSLWLEKDMWAIEPLRIHKGSSGRKLVMEWEYIASDQNFSCRVVSDEIRKIKKYFFEFASSAGAIYPLAVVKFSRVIPIETKFRIRDLNVTYGPELVNNDGIHPLYSKVSVQLELATNLNLETSRSSALDKTPKIDAAELGGAVVGWY
jgi:hypothetical protein